MKTAKKGNMMLELAGKIAKRELNPADYTPEMNPDTYYDQFPDSVLTEQVTQSVTDEEGNTLSQTTTVIRGKNRQETTTTYKEDDFGRTIQEDTSTRKYQDGKWLSAYETQVLTTYDGEGKVSQTETKSRKEGDTKWESQVVKNEYDLQGQVTKEYTPDGLRKGYASCYTYDVLGRKIKKELPQNTKDGAVCYQTVKTEYDTAGNVVAREEQIEGDKTARTEYTYDKQGNLVQVRSILDEEKEPVGSSEPSGSSQYVQYVYDIMGNKVRQFAGMTSPLTLTVSERSGTETQTGENKDIFTYGGKTYEVTVSGQKKSDAVRETKYAYNGKNELISCTDPEGRTETYTYDENGHAIKTIDKNGNVIETAYDYQNRLIKETAREKKRGKETVHTYEYDAYGNVAKQDDTDFVYGDVSGQVTKETTKLTKSKDVVKKYTYDSGDNKMSLRVKAGEETKLSLKYAYDGQSRLTSVAEEEGSTIAEYTYDTNGNLSQRSVPEAGLTSDYRYDYQNRLTGLTNQSDQTGILSQYNSTYQANGQKSEEKSTVVNEKEEKQDKTSAYTYDLMGRITKETKTGEEDITYTIKCQVPLYKKSYIKMYNYSCLT